MVPREGGTPAAAPPASPSAAASAAPGRGSGDGGPASEPQADAPGDAGSKETAPSPPAATAELAAPGAPPPAPRTEPPAAGAPAPPNGEEPEGVVRAPTASRPGRLKTIALDPGHGGPEGGAASGDLAEKRVNLRIALLLAELLQKDGFRVVLTRDSDRAVHSAFIQPGVRGQLTLDLQARVDIANGAAADLFLSVHNNGSADPAQRGTEVWFNRARPFSDRNLVLAQLVLGSILGHLRQIGHSTFDRGVKDDATFRIFRGRAYNIYVLGPGDGPRSHVPTAMPGVLGESLFLSNPGDAAALRRPETVLAIARGYRDAVHAYFERYPDP